MNEAHFRNLDLNLLRVFDALLDEQSATRAGAKLGLTQSAISHALGRLRLSLGDELFVRGPSGLQATPRAAEMGASIRAALKLMEAAVSTPVFAPATAQRVFHISASGYVGAVLMPSVVRRLLVEAPGVKLRMRGVEGDLAEELDRGRLDLVIGSFEHVGSRFTHVPLFTDTGVWVIRSGHPATRGEITSEVLAGLPHLLVYSGPVTGSASSQDSRGLGLKRITTWSETYALGSTSMRDFDGPVTVPDAYSALVMVSQTDMAALLPRRLAATAAASGKLVLIEPNQHPEPASFGAVIRSGEGEGGAVAWLLRFVCEVASEI